jgi:phage baseplate assembly protein W
VYYRVLDDFGDESNSLYFQAVDNPPADTAASISPAAFGPYPLLGSDVFLNPATGEGVIGPNGDLLSVNGLYLLCQDLRTRLITTQGELLLHPDFGMSRQRLIGSGQGDPVAQAQLLQTRIISVMELDPRVDHIESVEIVQVAMDAWTVSVTLVAIGAEDAGLQNLVFPFFLG